MKKIYILQLLNNKYYVGITSNLERRICEHFDGKGASWTKINKPIKVIETHDYITKFDEDIYTKMYMDKYGINNVRGGAYVKVNLDDIQKTSIIRELWHCNGLCMICGKYGHFTGTCSFSKRTTKPFEFWRDGF